MSNDTTVAAGCMTQLPQSDVGGPWKALVFKVYKL